MTNKTMLRNLISKIIQEELSLNEQRFSHWKRKYEELLAIPKIKNFINRFHKFRDAKLAERTGMESKPIASDARVRFVDKIKTKDTVGRTPGSDFDPKVNDARDNCERPIHGRADEWASRFIDPCNQSASPRFCLSSEMSPAPRRENVFFICFLWFYALQGFARQPHTNTSKNASPWLSKLAHANI